MAGVIKRKREVLTLKEKLEIIECLEKGEKIVMLMNKYKFGKSTIYDIKKNKEKIVSYLSTRETTSGMNKRQTLKLGSNESVEKAVCLWFLQYRARGTPISGPILTEKAMQFHGLMQDKESPRTFNASLGWLDNFKRRHGIRQLRIVGEKLSADTSSYIHPFIEKLYTLIQQDELQLEQLYNADETGLFWRLLPNKHL